MPSAKFQLYKVAPGTTGANVDAAPRHTWFGVIVNVESGKGFTVAVTVLKQPLLKV